jgi:hypothetical protein
MTRCLDSAPPASAFSDRRGRCLSFPKALYCYAVPRASIGMTRYLDHQGTPYVNRCLTIIINNVGIWWITEHQRGTRPIPKDQVAIRDFRREWTPDFFVCLVLHTRKCVSNGIRQIGNYWDISTSPLVD